MPRGTVTCIYDTLLKHFCLWSLFKNPATSHSRLIPKQQHDTLPTRSPLLLTERERVKKDDSGFRSDIKRQQEFEKERGGGKKKRLHLYCDSLLEKAGKCRAISLFFSPLLSIHLSVSVSLIKTCRRLGSRRAPRFGWDVKTHGEPKG